MATGSRSVPEAILSQVRYLIHQNGRWAAGTLERLTEVASPDGVPFDRLRIPGFVDLHLHGGFGIDFMSASRSEVADWADQLRDIGYSAFLPTTVTCPPDAARECLDKLPEHPQIAGMHLEGPFLSPKYPGAQPADLIMPVPSGPSDWDVVFDHPRLKLATIAPELEGAGGLAERLSARGVICSMGHSNATFSEAAQGVANGFVHATHTFNAMRPLHHREAGTVGFVLLDPRVRAELIYDRRHVCLEAAQLLIRTKGPEGVIAVSDATMAAGMEAGLELEMWGLRVRTGVGEVRLLDGTLAGSAITLQDAFRNLTEDFGLNVAVAACCTNPARALGHTPATIELDADLNVIGRTD